MKTKKILSIILALVMSFTLVACGGSNNDENNAAIQAKIDQTDALVEEIISLYEEAGYAEQNQDKLDMLRAQIDQIQANHQEILDGGGYDDEMAASYGETVDTAIAGYTEILDTLKAALESTK